VAFDYVITDNPGPSGIPAWLGLPVERGRLLWLLGGAMIAVTFVATAVTMVGRLQMTRLTKVVQVTMRRRIFAHLARLPLHRLQAIKSGGVASIIRDDAGSIGEMLFSVIYNPWRAVLTFLGGLLAMALLDWRMLVGGVLLVPAVYLSHRTWIGRIRPLYGEIKKVRTSADAHATEVFAGIRVVRSFGRRRAEGARFISSNGLMARQEMLTWWWSRIVDVAWTLMIPTASALVIVYGGQQVLAGRLTIGDVAAFSTYLLFLLGPLETLVSTASNLQNNLAALDRCLDVLAEPTEFGDVRSAAGRTSADSVSSAGGAAIAFENVSFSYPGHAQLVVSEVSLTVAAGQTVALVGPSGSGKTTLCNLVARFFDPTSGRISLNGRDLREIPIDDFRALLGIVEQEVFLFDGTVAENIAYARRDAHPHEIAGAAAAANAAGFIEGLEKKYDTVIGERGVRLSGGQKQRLAIARALLADPRILILDEATSNLDSESEAMIQHSLSRLMKGRTCFVIAHRLSTVRNADR
ncbi:MAG: ABC transporter ATP-binding protein, partial [Phycisphaerales bacterium]